MTDIDTIAKAFSVHMCAKFGATVREKENATEMQAIAWGMDLGKFVGVTGLASSAEFMTRYTTTLGTNIYMPKGHRENPLTFIEVLTHECQHVAQFKESGIEFAWLYLSEAEARVKYEVDAYAAGVAINQWLTGKIPTDTAEWIVSSLVSGYHLRQEDAELAEKLLKSHLVSLKNGVIMSKSGREALAFLDANYPKLRGTT